MVLYASLCLGIAGLSGCMGDSEGDWTDADGLGSDGDGGDEAGDAPVDPDELILSPDLVVMDDDPCVASVDVPEDRELLTFEFACDPLTHQLAEGRIVVGTEGGGYLRRIVALEEDGMTVRAWTEEASLNEVIEHGSMAELITPNVGRNLIDFSNTTLYSGEYLGSNILVRLSRARFDIAPALVLDGHWSYGEMEHFEMDLGVDFTADVLATVSSTNRLRWGQETKLWEMIWPFAFAIGPVPVAGALTLALKVGFRIDAPGQMSTSLGANGAMNIHTKKSWVSGFGWVDNDVFEGNWDIVEPSLNTSNRFKARIYARLDSSIQMYGVAGPRVATDLFVQGIGTADCAGLDYQVDAGIESRCSVRINILDKFKPEKTFARATLTADLLEGSVGWPVGSPVLCDHRQIRCGQTVFGDTSESDMALMDGYDCNVGNYEAAEVVYQWKANRSGTVHWELQDADPTTTNHDVVVVDGYMQLATGSCSAWGTNSVEFEAVEGTTYFLVVDGYNEDHGPYRAKLICDEDEGPDTLGTINPW
ncbi:MAG: hypothetical protein CL928_06470 [Deltaproteobacteria bacterium]|nr:hypothetical protein [Deltaproteobacteria bacterium]